MTTGQRIRNARKEANMTQAELAQKLNIPFQSISQWERDVRKPKIETLQRIADALLVHLTSLLDQTAKEAYYVGIDTGSALEEWQQHIIDELRKDDGYTDSDIEGALIAAFSQLNPEGQSKAVERVEELTEIPKYKKEPP